GVTHTLTLQQNITPGSITVSTGTSYTIDTNGKSIGGGTTGLTIQAGQLTLQDSSATPGANTFAGTIDIGGGTPVLGAGGTLGTGAVTAGGGTLQVNRTITIANALTNSLNLGVAGGGAVTLTNTGNTFTGTVNVTNGTLVAGAAGALPSM